MSYSPTEEIIHQASELHKIIEKWPDKALAPDEKQVLLAPYLEANPERFLDLSQYIFYAIGAEWMDMGRNEMLSVLASIASEKVE